MELLTKDTCVIEHASLHKLDNRKDEPLLADLPLKVDGPLHEFITSHIVSSITNCNIAVFEDRANNVVSRCCEAVFADPNQLISQSHVLARGLFKHMQNLTIKAGTFLFAVFQNLNDGQQYAAIMKLDDTRAFTYEETSSDGEKVIRVDVNDHALPDPKTKLDKAAFVVPTRREDLGYELKLLDRGRVGDGVAKYFQAFLACKSPQSDREKTKIFSREVERWIQGHKDELPDTIRESYLREFKYAYLRNNDEVVVQQFAEQIFGQQNENLRDDLIQHLRANKLQDAEFAVEFGPRESSKTVYQFSRGDQKIEIRGDFDAVTELVRVAEPTEGQPHYMITIEADDWKQLSR